MNKWKKVLFSSALATGAIVGISLAPYRVATQQTPAKGLTVATKAMVRDPNVRADQPREPVPPTQDYYGTNAFVPTAKKPTLNLSSEEQKTLDDKHNGIKENTLRYYDGQRGKLSKGIEGLIQIYGAFKAKDPSLRQMGSEELGKIYAKNHDEIEMLIDTHNSYLDASYTVTATIKQYEPVLDRLYELKLIFAGKKEVMSKTFEKWPEAKIGKALGAQLQNGDVLPLKFAGPWEDVACVGTDIVVGALAGSLIGAVFAPFTFGASIAVGLGGGAVGYFADRVCRKVIDSQSEGIGVYPYPSGNYDGLPYTTESEKTSRGGPENCKSPGVWAQMPLPNGRKEWICAVPVDPVPLISLGKQ